MRDRDTVCISASNCVFVWMMMRRTTLLTVLLLLFPLAPLSLLYSSNNKETNCLTVSVCLCVCMSVCLYACVSVCLYDCVCMPVCLYVGVSVCLYVGVSVSDSAGTAVANVAAVPTHTAAVANVADVVGVMLLLRTHWFLRQFLRRLS